MQPDAPVRGPEPGGGILNLLELDVESLRDVAGSPLAEAIRRVALPREDDTEFVLHQRSIS
jgi:hypothetical protein